MRSRVLLVIRLVLLLGFVGFVAVFAVGQYSDVRSLVTVLCLSCIGIG